MTDDISFHSFPAKLPVTTHFQVREEWMQVLKTLFNFAFKSLFYTFVTTGRYAPVINPSVEDGLIYMENMETGPEIKKLGLLGSC
ncbi:MAG: hypothetical protein PHP04_08475 [Bacteroidales bacterium]|nr:hypothetical protein [Bacteroidales bacterium]